MQYTLFKFPVPLTRSSQVKKLYMRYSLYMKRTFIFLLVPILIASVLLPSTLTFAKSKKVVIKDTPTLTELVQKYEKAETGKEKVRILIVPGHEPDFGGAEYQGVYEREITVETADQLADYLKQNSRFEVIIARSNTEWNDDLA